VAPRERRGRGAARCLRPGGGSGGGESQPGGHPAGGIARGLARVTLGTPARIGPRIGLREADALGTSSCAPRRGRLARAEPGSGPAAEAGELSQRRWRRGRMWLGAGLFKLQRAPGRDRGEDRQPGAAAALPIARAAPCCEFCDEGWRTMSAASLCRRPSRRAAGKGRPAPWPPAWVSTGVAGRQAFRLSARRDHGVVRKRHRPAGRSLGEASSCLVRAMWYRLPRGAQGRLSTWAARAGLAGAPPQDPYAPRGPRAARGPPRAPRAAASSLDSPAGGTRPTHRARSATPAGDLFSPRSVRGGIRRVGPRGQSHQLRRIRGARRLAALIGPCGVAQAIPRGNDPRPRRSRTAFSLQAILLDRARSDG